MLEGSAVGSSVSDEEWDGNLGAPAVVNGNRREEFVSELKSDQTLNSVRVLADTCKMGYQWENGLIFHLSEDAVDGPKKKLVVPKSRRTQLVDLAHDRAGHVGSKKTRELLNSRFTWPGLGRDVQR